MLSSMGPTKKSIMKGSPLHKLDPILINGLLRVGGRLHCSPIDEDAKHPILLPKGHPIANLIIRHYHKLCGHSGVEHTLALIRERYWIINGREYDFAKKRNNKKPCSIRIPVE